ncbi:sulfur carrier protein ThiS adenylyltransferase ThiF [uncultured Mailhella sp.]|uniref:sulfur carrier protein ThiS adenylyltransferase ThiF n=1 Tax=uncultured Mailhella sp. TaxID=1981031 RepID=UPI0025DDE7D9|nr:sulfur carrier protein ThiS adenylyltransferase ThiF [uncultured Mailhella sp.]
MLEGALSCFTAAQRIRLESARVGIAGAGGLGSNAAVMLARSGVGHLIVIDGDIVEPSNLNRQHYFPAHVGRAKTEALKEQLLCLNPDLDVDARRLWLDRNNIPPLLDAADLWIEALDRAETKALFVSAAAAAKKTVICGSGMGGFGGCAMTRRSLGRIIVVGDMKTDVADRPPLAPRVMQCAAMQADAALEWLLNGTIEALL